MADTYVEDLTALYRIARTDILKMAQSYSDLANGLDAARSRDIVQRSTNYGHSQPALRGAAQIAEACDDLQYAFALSSQSTEECANSLMTITETYAAADEETESEFAAQLNELYGDDAVAQVTDPKFPAGSAKS